MSIRRGFFRIWIVLSTLWVLLWGYELFSDVKQLRAIHEVHLQDRQSEWQRLNPLNPAISLRSDVFLLISFPVGTIAIWFVLSWIVAGFRGNKKPVSLDPKP
jgi:hypothetical protein